MKDRTVPRNLYSQKNRLIVAVAAAIACNVLLLFGLGRLYAPSEPSTSGSPSILRIGFVPPAMTPPKAAIIKKEEPQRLSSDKPRSATETAANSPKENTIAEEQNSIPLAEKTSPAEQTGTHTVSEPLPAAENSGNISTKSGGSDSSEDAFSDFETLSEGMDLPLPPYPQSARRWGQEGVVRLKIFITANGSVMKTEIIASSGYGILDSAAVRTVEKSWKFRPPGKTVSVEKEFAFILD